MKGDDPWIGRTYHLPSGTRYNSEKSHLFIVLTEPRVEKGDANKVLLVSVSSRLKSDKTCILKSGAHPFIKYQSYVIYERMEICSIDFLEGQSCDENMSARLMERICRGVFDSPLSQARFETFYKASLS